jgi:hypothetical protein
VVGESETKIGTEGKKKRRKGRRRMRTNLVRPVTGQAVEVPYRLDRLGSLDICEPGRGEQSSRKNGKGEKDKRVFRDEYTPPPLTVFASFPSVCVL